MIDLKSIVETLDGKPVLVFGLGLTGGSLVKALKKAGAYVVVGDDNPETLAKMQKSLDVDVLENYGDMAKFGFLLLSPGVPLTHPEPHEVVKAAMAVNLPVIGDVELFSKAIKGNLTIGITGTNGKSTTATLVYHVLKECGLKVDLGGNIGKPVFDLKMPKKNGVAVMELSSFQIDLCPSFRTDVSVLLNLSPDHIDRHGTMEHYASVKERLMEKPEQGSINPVAVIATDDDFCAQIYARVKEKGERKIIEVSATRQLSDGVYVKDGILFDAKEGVLLQVGNLQEIQSLRGIHNAQNAACAYAAARATGLEPEQIFEAMKTFPGLQHRQFLVRTINGVAYVNDSKATNAAATAMALGCHNNIYWIVGGRKKKTGLDGLEGYFNHIKHAFLIGESMADFAEWFDKYGIEYTRCGTMDRAVQNAHAMAQENRGQPGGAGVVLLSPACASFDQFKNFEERGDAFTSLANDLDEGV